MKGHMFCASQASTAVCFSMDHIDKTAVAGAGAAVDDERRGRAIDRHNPIIRDGRRPVSAPCSSVDVPKPPPYRQLQRTKMPSSDEDPTSRKVQKGRKSFSGGVGGGSASLFKLNADDITFARRSFGCARPVGGFIRTPPGSSRYLLSDDQDALSGSLDLDPVFAESDPSESKRGSHALKDGKKDADSSEKKVSPDQVVVLRVSLHCKGCEGKVRKHLSRMQGVTSFSIDFASKKVTVTGDVTPLEVLASISKVKNAQLWTPNPQPTPPSMARANLEI